MKTFKNLHDIYKAFPDNESCRKHLEELRWNGQPVCPHCGSTKKPYALKDGKTYKCSEKLCAKKFTAIVGTIFENTKVPLQKFFLAIYIATSHKKGISSLQLGRDIGVTQKTAWFILHRIREMLNEKSPVMLTGTVEVDETWVGGKFSNKHQSLHAKKQREGLTGDENKTIVLGLVQRGEGKVVNKIIKSTKNTDIYPVIEKHITKGSFMLTDDWKAYRSLPKFGYVHDYVNHSTKEYVRGSIHTSTIDGYWSLLKRGIIGIYHFVSSKHLHRYCDEFTYRYNTRKQNESERFNNSIIQCSGKRLKYKNLIAE